MSIEATLYALLSVNAGVIAQVADRIYPDVLPEECAYPAIVFARSRTEPYPSLSGLDFGADVTLAIDCWAETRTAAAAAATAVKAALLGTAFTAAGPESVADPETGLFASQLTAVVFEPPA